MGYYTEYELNIECNGESIEDIVNYIKTHEVMNYALYIPHSWDKCDTSLFCGINESCKWYDHDTDMVVMSARFPRAMFILEGQGEDYEDGWQTWYEGGEIKGNRSKEWSWTDWA